MDKVSYRVETETVNLRVDAGEKLNQFCHKESHFNFFVSKRFKMKSSDKQTIYLCSFE